MIKFDSLEPLSEEVELAGKKYILLEPTENVAIKWRNSNIRGAKMNDGKVVGVDNIAESQSVLVAGCLYEANADGRLPTKADGLPDESKLVQIATVRRWPASVVRELFDKAKQMGKLDEKKKEGDEGKAPTPNGELTTT